MELTKQKLTSAFPAMKEEFGYKNIMAAPRLSKIVISVGTGRRSRTDKKVNEFIAGRLALIAGQKPVARPAKKSIASFKVRLGDPVGQMVTLRGGQMVTFLDKLIHIALPRTKDFRGISKNAVDSMGNLTIGIKEHTIFPETSDEELKDVFGLAVILVSTAKNKKEGIAFFEHLGVPFKKVEEEVKKGRKKK